MLRLSVTAIKGLSLRHPDAVCLTRAGAEGDRRFFLVDDRGHPVSITKVGALARFVAEYDSAADVLSLRTDDGRHWTRKVRRADTLESDFYGLRTVPCQVVEGPWANVLSEAAGRSLRLVSTPQGVNAFDGHPVTILGRASVHELVRRPGSKPSTPEGSGCSSNWIRLSPGGGLVGGTAGQDRWGGGVDRQGRAEVRGGHPEPRERRARRPGGAGD